MPVNWGHYWWPIWIIITFTLFIIPEVIALFTPGANTLSQFCWNELAASPRLPLHTVAWNLSLIGWLLAVIVLTIHIWFKGV